MNLHREKNRKILESKSIIGCTTTGAANFVQSIQAVSPEIVLVEEAGEILESHILTALSPNTEQLILIGDHKQLRPKVHYDLSQAKDAGYDLDISMFERLVLKGYPHQTLSLQHRMRPEFSMLIRKLTYPQLSDANSTKGRPNLRGFQSNLVFVDHNHVEDGLQHVIDPRDALTGSSKQNEFEARMTLKCVKYLGQQGYGTDKIVVLTPYVAQLRLLFDILGKENDPVLNDLDTHDLVRAGLMPSATARLQKRRINLSSIGDSWSSFETPQADSPPPDNYQGEQSDVVVVSLTRSNKKGDIGFLSSPERLNVLLSRARIGMILIGNADTFLSSRKGKSMWQKLFDMLKDGKNIFDGLPVACAKHPDRKRILRRPEEFDEHCPDGGCSEPW